MKIKSATENDILESLRIAGELKEWFTRDALSKMKRNFKNNLIVCFDKGILGFLNYRVNKKSIKILWIGVDKKNRRKGIGKKLLNAVEKIAKNNNIKKINVDTLSYKDDYKPYVSTRDFYLKNGFRYVHILPKKKNEDEQVRMEKTI